MELTIINNIREVTFSKLIVKHPSIRRDIRLVTRLPNDEIIALAPDAWRPYSLLRNYPELRYVELITPLG